MRGREPVLVLVLAGVVVGALAGSAISLLKVLADPYDQLPAITFWLLGSLAGIKPSDLRGAVPVVLLGLVPLVLLRWRIDVLSLGDEEARALGVEAARLRIVVIAAATLITASVVAISGVIGWVGLIMPHIARMLVGPNFDRLLPAAMLLGAGYLLLVDTLARSIARGRDAARHPHRLRRRAVLPLAAGARPARLGMTARGAGRSASAIPASRSAATSISRSAPARCSACSAPTAAGKTTLFRTLLGLLPAQGGEVRLDGRPLAALPRAEIARRIAYVPQAHAAQFPYTRARHGADGPHRASRAVRPPRRRATTRPPWPRSRRSASPTSPTPTTPGSAAASASSR